MKSLIDDLDSITFDSDLEKVIIPKEAIDLIRIKRVERPDAKNDKGSKQVVYNVEVRSPLPGIIASGGFSGFDSYDEAEKIGLVIAKRKIWAARALVSILNKAIYENRDGTNQAPGDENTEPLWNRG